jgi:hypothetical protein
VVLLVLPGLFAGVFVVVVVVVVMKIIGWEKELVDYKLSTSL